MKMKSLDARNIFYKGVPRQCPKVYPEVLPFSPVTLWNWGGNPSSLILKDKIPRGLEEMILIIRPCSGR